MFNAKTMKKRSIHKILDNIKQSITTESARGYTSTVVKMEDCEEWNLAAIFLEKRGFTVNMTKDKNMEISWN